MDIVNYLLENVYVVIPAKDSDKPYMAAIVAAKVIDVLYKEIERKFGLRLTCEDISKIVESICSLYEVSEVSYRLDTREVRYTFRPKMEVYRIAIYEEVKTACKWCRYKI